MDVSQILTPVIFLGISLILVIAGWTELRNRRSAFSYWCFGWGVLALAGAVLLTADSIPAIEPISFLPGSLFAPLMAMGAFVQAKRDIPDWILPTGFALGAARLTCLLIGQPEAAWLLSVGIEPCFGLLGAYVMTVPARPDDASIPRSDRVLALGFIAIAGAEAADAAARSQGLEGPALWVLWGTLCLSLFAYQIYLRIRTGSQSALEEAQAYADRLQIVTRASKDFLVEYDDRGTITFVSANVERIPGRVASEIVGHNIAEFFVENISSGVIELLQKRRRLDADDVDGEVHLARGLVPAHADRWYESTTGSYRTPAGELRFVARVRDVSERIAGEVRIRENEARLVRAERIANVGSWEWRPQGDHLIWSDQMTRMHGLEPNETESNRELLYRLMIPEDREPFRQCIRKAVRERVGFETDYRIRRPGEDETRTLHVQGELDIDDEGNVTKMAGTTVDVTDRVRMNEALRIGEERFRMLFDSNVVGVFYIEADGHIREANNALLDLIGYEKEDLPLSWEELTPPDRLPRSMEAREELRNGMGAAPYETEFVRGTGDRVPVLITAARIGEQDAIVLALDLSEQKNAEQQIARYQRELEETVEQRTRELVDSQNRLVETQRLAAIGTLAAGVAHQINNPVGAILNSAEYALLCKDDDDAASIFERALRDNLAEARRCAQIVRSILQFSRDEPTEKRTEDLNGVARRAQRATKPIATDRDARVGLRVPKEKIFVEMSPIEIEQVVVNVVQNAIESQPRGATVEISLSTIDERALIEVTDDGRGIPEENLDRIFDPFFTTRTREGGTGLGLSVAHGIVSDHGGEIVIESEPGKGTRVQIYLPLESVAPDDVDER